MVNFSFKDIKFKQEKDKIKGVFLKYYYFYLDKAELENIGSFKVKKDEIIFQGISEKKAAKFNFLLSNLNIKLSLTNL